MDNGVITVCDRDSLVRIATTLIVKVAGITRQFCIVSVFRDLIFCNTLLSGSVVRVYCATLTKYVVTQ
jgi:hypothetical protein